ncbi:uncharacterized protein LOC111087508, partial [Limulus polyphemus]|uniref:Uncharacterized protein LOC111087508 n=1 Tax=Limulus polyphemus TaxID=6850 RepID=A0ABM1T2G3_LIMPO
MVVLEDITCGDLNTKLLQAANQMITRLHYPFSVHVHTIRELKDMLRLKEIINISTVFISTSCDVLTSKRLQTLAPQLHLPVLTVTKKCWSGMISERGAFNDKFVHLVNDLFKSSKIRDVIFLRGYYHEVEDLLTKHIWNMGIRSVQINVDSWQSSGTNVLHHVVDFLLSLHLELHNTMLISLTRSLLSTVITSQLLYENVLKRKVSFLLLGNPHAWLTHLHRIQDYELQLTLISDSSTNSPICEVMQNTETREIHRSSNFKKLLGESTIMAIQ